MKNEIPPIPEKWHFSTLADYQMELDAWIEKYSEPNMPSIDPQ
jgi:hypothetical protein